MTVTDTPKTAPTSFPFIPVTGGKVVTLQAESNSKYLGVDHANGCKLYASEVVPGDHERFRVEILDDLPTAHLRHGGLLALREGGANGPLVCAELGGGQELVANRDKIGPWETFSVRRLSDGFGAGPDIASGDKIALRVCNGQFVTADKNLNGKTDASAWRVDVWEVFRITVA